MTLTQWKKVERNLPEEIVVQILLRLPVKALLRCTGVCKSWYSLITSSYFISLHLRTTAALDNDPHLSVRRWKRSWKDGSSTDYGVTYDYCNDYFDEPTKFECLFLCLSGFSEAVSINGFCNGLLFVYDEYFQQIVIWNPSIKKAVSVPQPKGRSSIDSLGFGFDSITNDYKIVKLSGYCQPIQVELYKLSSGVWQNISPLELLDLELCPQGMEKISPAYMNRAFHWVGFRRPQFRYSIVMFDMHLEVFGEMPMWDTFPVLKGWTEISTWVYMGMLSVIVRDGPDRCSVWIMKAYGVAESWTKQFSLVLHDGGVGFRRPLGFRNTGELIFEKDDGYLISYDCQGLKFRNLEAPRSKWSRNVFYVDNFRPSLVFLDRGAKSA